MNIKVNPDVKVQGSRLTFESSITKLYGCLIRIFNNHKMTAVLHYNNTILILYYNITCLFLGNTDLIVEH